MGKVYTLSEAISKFVHNGDHICFGGFTTNRKPYAAVREILRQGLGDFIVEAALRAATGICSSAKAGSRPTSTAIPPTRA